jgi:hypothetical protein
MPWILWAIARNTFIESIRQPVYTVLLGLGLGLLAINLVITAYSFDDDTKLMIDMGMGTILVCGLMLASFTATGVLWREIENRTALTVISKPIPRGAFVVGKYLGVTGAIGAAVFVWALAFLMCARHGVISSNYQQADVPVLALGGAAIVAAVGITAWGNFFYGWVFPSRLLGVLSAMLGGAAIALLWIDKQWRLQPPLTELTRDDGRLAQIALAIGVVMIGLAVVGAVAVAASTRLGQVATLTACFVTVLLGLASDYLLGRHVGAHPAAWIAYAAVPNLQYFWLTDALTQQHPIGLDYVALAAGYGAMQIGAVLCVGVAMFQTRQTG